MTDRATVGATRDFLAAHYDVPDEGNTHFVLIAEAENGTTVSTCCDGLEEATGMLRLALREIGASQPTLATVSPSVIVGRDDLKAVLNDRPCANAEVLSRLRAALGEDAGR